MPEQKMSLEDILNEYSSDSPKADSNNGRLETEKLLNSAEKLSGSKSAEDIIKETDNLKNLHKHSKRELDNPLRRPNPANDVKPADLSRNKVSFVNSELSAIYAPLRKAVLLQIMKALSGAVRFRIIHRKSGE